MTIHFNIKPNWDEHLADVQGRWAQSATSNGSRDPILLVVHTYRDYNAKDFSRWIDIGQEGGGVLFISGAPLDEEARLKEQLSAQCPGMNWPKHWHVLRASVQGKNAGPVLGSRFDRFFTSCTELTAGEPPWKELYPTFVGENILAVYMWCLAESRLTEREVEANSDLIRIESNAWGEMCGLKSNYGIAIPPLSVLKRSRMLDPNGCQEFIHWAKRGFASGGEGLKMTGECFRIPMWPHRECPTVTLGLNRGHSWWLRMLHDGVKDEWQAERRGERVAELPAEVAYLDSKIIEAERTLELAIDELSPARLVDEGPMARLSEEARAVIREAVHARYIEAGVIQPMCDELRLALLQIKAISPSIAREWNGNGRERLIKDLLNASLRVSKAIDSFMGGYIVP